MLELIRRNLKVKLVLISFILLSVWWLLIQLLISNREDNSYIVFASAYGFVALLGGLFGLRISRSWGGFRSYVGRSLIFFSLGLLAQEFGQLAYSYYIYYLHVAVPYPSIGDIGFFGSIPFYIVGCIYLAKASGVYLSMKSLKGRLSTFLIPLLLLVISYWFFLKGYEFDWTQPLKVLLDFGYPLGQTLYISIALITYVLSRDVLGGIMKNKVLFILFALLVQYVSDFVFLYSASRGVWYAGGFNDYMYLVAYFLMALALISVSEVVERVRQNLV